MVGALFLWAIVGAAAVASAQAPEQGAPVAPYRGTFGGAWTDTLQRRSLELSSSILEGFDHDRQVDTLGQAPIFRVNGKYTGLLASIDFQSRGKTVQWRAGAGSNMRYNPSFPTPLTGSHYQAAGLSVQLPGRTTVTVDETAAYAPAFVYDMFPTAPGPTLAAPVTPMASAADYSAAAARFYTYQGNAQVTTNVSRRVSISVNGGIQRTNPINQASAAYSTRSTAFGGGVSFHLSRTAALRLGYQSRNVILPSRLQLRERNIDLGIDYQRALSRSRRTTMAFTASTTSFTGPVFNAPPNTFAQQFGFSADASLNHRIGRTWNLRGVYHRGVNVIEGFEVPLFTDGVSATLIGFIARRADLSASGGYSTGNSILVTSRSRVATSTANARMRFALNRTFATFVEYAYYHYDFDQSLQLPAGVTPRLQRDSVRVGLTIWVRPWSQR